MADEVQSLLQEDRAKSVHPADKSLEFCHGHDASSTGRTSRGGRPSTGSSRGRESSGQGGSYDESGRGSLERTGRNVIGGPSVRDPASGGGGSHGGAPPEGFRSAVMATALPEPLKKGSTHGSIAGGEAIAVLNDPAYLFTDDYPFSADKLDLVNERQLGADDPARLAAMKELPQMIPSSKKLLNLTPAMATDLEKWDLECASNHLDAIKDSVMTHDDLYDFVLMDGEYAKKSLDLAGLEDAPGLYDDVTQRCRVVFTNENRLVFTQAKHSAEMGLPKMTCIASVLQCFHDRSSRRKWSSFYASINATEILQVVVQQTLTTSYETSTCTFNDVFGALCCPTGGTLYSEKDMNGATQTLGDKDPGECLSRWDKTRFMRHALVIRYVDCASNSVLQTTAMAHPSTPASKLYEMAREIEAHITVRTADWLKNKTVPIALPPMALRNSPPAPPLYQRKSYKRLLFVLLVIALIFLAIDRTAAIFMIIAVVVALTGSYSSMKSSGKVARKTANMVLGNVSKTLIGTQGGGLAVYALSFFLALNNRSTSDTASSSFPYST
ncbi:unnamed protein product [Scytosiphon promiscuus]